MGVLIELLANYAPYIYLVCGLVALYQLYRLFQVRADRRQAVFSLERERAIRNLYSIFTVALILVLAMGITYFAGSTLPRASAAQPTPDEGLPPEFSLQIIPTNTPLPVTPSATPTTTITPSPPPPTITATVDPAVAALTPTAQAQPTATATPQSAPPPSAPVAAAATCDERGNITAPGNGAVVSGGFTYLADGRGQVYGGALASVDTRGFGNGPWTFQLTVVDQTGNYPEPCRVTVIVQN